MILFRKLFGSDSRACCFSSKPNFSLLLNWFDDGRKELLLKFCSSFSICSTASL